MKSRTNAAHVLDGLDDIPWAALSHAYGSAADVPELLRALSSDDQELRSHAHQELLGNIWHQGTVYEATAHAVPFLLSLLDDSALPERESVLRIFARIAEGVGYLEVHARDADGQASWRRILEARGMTLEAAMAREADVVAAVRREVEKGMQYLLPMLHDIDAELRASVASALSFYPSHAERSVAALAGALAQEADVDVRAAIEATIDHLSDLVSPS